MMRPALVLVSVLSAALLLAPEPARAQAAVPAATPPVSLCGLPVPIPANQPPAGSEPVMLAFLLCFEKQGGTPMIEPQTYLYHIRLRPSEPSRERWIAFTQDTEALIREDFQRLWATNFLDDLAIEAHDYPFANGVVGKIVVFSLEERQRVKIVDYEGLTKIDQSAIEEKLKEKSLVVRLDSFLDSSTLKRAADVVRALYAEKGYQYAEVTPTIREADGVKLVHVTFNIVEGPKVAIRDVEFLGNRALSDEALASVLKENRAEGLLSFVNGKGTFNEDKFAQDAQAIVDHYRDRGYVNAQVGQPVLKVLDDSGDGRTRWVQMRVPITEGLRYTVGTVSFDGNAVVNGEALGQIFKIRAGDIYRQKDVRKGLETAREVYGAGGYFEFTAYPDLQPRERVPDERGTASQFGNPIVDVTIRVDEGKQYFINRITFLGNTHTRDTVIRRELALVEAGVFNTQALKSSIRRLNQLGYFKALDDAGVSVEKSPGTDNKVDIELKVEEQSRNQISFGAGASQNEGFFGNASFTTANFLGRGESLTVSLQKGSRANNYQISFSEPFIFGRQMTAGVSVFSRKIDYQISSTDVDYSEVRTGGNVSAGVPLRRYTRGFVTYGYEVVDTAVSNLLESSIAADPSTSTQFLLAVGRQVESSITPSIVHNTVDNPYAPRDGMRLTGRYQYSGGVLGGTTDFVRPDVEAILYRPVTRRTALGFRANAGWTRNYGSTELPYYLRYLLGGETHIRGVDIRSVGPTNANGVPIGGTKFVLFNAEYYVDLMPQVRALLFHDAGQSFSEEQSIDFRQLRTSTGAELRVTLPVIGVPFRLIYAWNIYRDATQPARTFKFAVGTTF